MDSVDTVDLDIYCKIDASNIHVLNEPILLPCKNSVCYKCIERYIKLNKTSFNCSYCFEEHYIKNPIEFMPNSQFIDKLKQNLASISWNFIQKVKKSKLDLQGKIYI